MDTATDDFGSFGVSSKHIARRFLTIGENRLELFLVEVQEERERLLRTLLLALGVAVVCLLAGITLTAAVVVLFWAYSPVAILLILTGLYATVGIWLWRRLTRLQRDWQLLSATLDQFRKDCACLEEVLA